MLYDDEQGDCITPEDVFERLEEDLEVATAVIWVGISFEQSASTEYFRKVRDSAYIGIDVHYSCFTSAAAVSGVADQQAQSIILYIIYNI